MRTRLVCRARAAVLSLIAILFAAPVLATAQAPVIPPHELQVIQGRGLIVYRLTTNEGIVIVTLPDGLKEGDAFSGSLEMLGTVSSTMTLDYRIALGDQRARVKDGTFHWKMPGNLDGYARLRFLGFHGEEIATTDLPISSASGSTEPPLPDPDQLHLPEMVQTDATLPVFGPLDGDSRTTSVQIGGQSLRVIAEMPGRAIVEGPKDLAALRHTRSRRARSKRRAKRA
jgi:hypothetical protein